MNDDNFYTFDEYSERKAFDELQRRFRDHEDREEAMKKHPAGKDTKANPPRLSDETNTYLGMAVFRFIFVILPLALLLTGIAVVPATEAIFNTEIGFWTAFFLLMTIRWLILQPRNNLFLWKLYEQKGR